jgi:four helix bundle protein
MGGRVRVEVSNDFGFMSNENLKLRIKKFGLDVIAFIEKLPRDRTCDILGRQLLRSATSVGANYRLACRATSTPDFISKMGIVEEEADESGYWLEMLQDSGKAREQVIKPLLQESRELVAIMVSSIITARKSPKNTSPRPSRTPHSK